MSDQVPPRRPAAVVLAAGLLVGMAVAGLANAAAGLLTLDGTATRFRAATTDVADRSAVDAVATLVGVFTVLAAVLAVVVAVLLFALALGLLARRNAVRVTTWVVAGLGLLAGCGALAVLVGQRTIPFRLDRDEATTAVLFDALTSAYPAWWIPLNAGLSVGQVLGYLVVATLLALPTANAYYRRRPPTPPHVPPPSGPSPSAPSSSGLSSPAPSSSGPAAPDPPSPVPPSPGPAGP
ncbi:hypothetical protein [Micromonospora cathayae]|uniref:DUF2567 domain-containing protein n=1 Tax=Micromonospora cathayae TaxID=3028804 RepID=A0ABY7ZTD5_9ACTN|nr:hypothetical protein [Micromonospora sp. HUAS 3]WDZ86143.1 hypothetical protein PVK37_06910 [Micromonospora sp. HUAS 3]